MKFNLTPDFLDDATPDDVAALTPDYLAHLQAMLAEDKKILERRAAKLHGGLLLRYRDRVTAELAPKAGVGTAHVEDDGYDVVVTISKRVEWDQTKLMGALAEMPDEQAEYYAKYTISVEERKYSGAPPDIQKKLAPARTIRAGKPTFEFKRREQEAA